MGGVNETILLKWMLKEMWCEGVSWVQVRVRWRYFVDTIMKVRSS